MNSTQSTKLILSAGRNIHALEFAVKQIEKSAINEYKRRLSESKNFIEIEDFDLLTEQRDNNGLSRYTVKNSVDGFVMVPDLDGFWSPNNQFQKSRGE